MCLSLTQLSPSSLVCEPYKHFLQLMALRVHFKTSVALATESSRYMWSRILCDASHFPPPTPLPPSPSPPLPLTRLILVMYFI